MNNEHNAYKLVSQYHDAGLGYDAIMQNAVVELIGTGLAPSVAEFAARQALGDISSKGLNAYVDISNSDSHCILVIKDGARHAITLRELANYLDSRD